MAEKILGIQDRRKLDQIVQALSTEGHSDDEIQAVVDDFKKTYARPESFWDKHPTLKTITEGVTSTLPALGAVTGGAVAAPSMIAGVPGVLTESAAVGLGAGAGRALENTANQALGLEPPKSLKEGATEAAKDVGYGTVSQALLPGSVGQVKGLARAGARNMGGLVEETGHAMNMPLRMGGVYKIMSKGGLPGKMLAAGTGTMAKGIEKAGGALRGWGEAEPGFMRDYVQKTLGQTRGAIDPDKAMGAMKLNSSTSKLNDMGLAVAESRPEIAMNPSDLRASRAATRLSNVKTGMTVDEAIADAQAQADIKASDLAKKQAEETAKAESIRAARAASGVEARPASFSTTQSASTPTGREVQMTRFGPHVETPEEELARITKGGGGSSKPAPTQEELEAWKAEVRATRNAPTPEAVVPTPEGDEARLAKLAKIREGVRVNPSESNEDFAARMRAKQQQPPIRVGKPGKSRPISKVEARSQSSGARNIDMPEEGTSGLHLDSAPEIHIDPRSEALLRESKSSRGTTTIPGLGTFSGNDFEAMRGYLVEHPKASSDEVREFLARQAGSRQGFYKTGGETNLARKLAEPNE